MSTVSVSPLEAFQWTPQPAAQALVDRLIADFQTHNAAAPLLAKLMKEETGTRFGDWVDSIIVPRSNSSRRTPKTTPDAPEIPITSRAGCAL